MIIENRRPPVCVAWLALMILGGCSTPAVELDSAAHQSMIEADRKIAEDVQQGAAKQISLTLDQALQRGVVHNLDARVAALEILVQQKNVTLESLKALPSLNASRGYLGRDNDGASSSRSVLSGLESLEPSQSSDRDRQTAALELNWNLLDVALAYADAQKADMGAQISRERHEKVIHNIERDVYAAYWRAYAYQSTKTQTDALLVDTGRQIDRLNKAVKEKLISADMAGDQVVLLNDRVRSLKELNDQLNLSQIELKSLLALPMNADLVLQKPDARASDYKSLLNESLEAQEWAALKNRPEVREEILQKNLTLQDTKREILTTLPGMELFVGANYDSNSFMQDSTWISSSAKLVQSIIGIFTLPTRYHAAKTKEDLADARRQALVAAVLAQTNIARTRLMTREMAYQDALRSLRSASSKSSLVGHKVSAGFASGQSALQARLENQIETVRSQLAQADVQDSYAAYMNTLGRRFFQPVNLTQAMRGAS